MPAREVIPFVLAGIGGVGGLVSGFVSICNRGCRQHESPASRPDSVYRYELEGPRMVFEELAVSISASVEGLSPLVSASLALFLAYRRTYLDVGLFLVGGVFLFA